MKTTYEYYRPDWQDEAEGLDEFESDHSGHDVWDYKWTVEAICDARFSDWDYECPGILKIRRKGETEWMEFDCEVESVPQFSAWRKKQ